MLCNTKKKTSECKKGKDVSTKSDRRNFTKADQVLFVRRKNIEIVYENGQVVRQAKHSG